jgi:release factor glutamine methyltransferase
MPNIAKIDKTVNSRKLFVELLLRVDLPEPQSETNEKVLMLMEKTFGLSRSQLLTGREVKCDKSTRELLNAWADRLNNHEPVQYILGEAHFYGRTFKVNPDVLIPRPETEELVHLALGLLIDQRAPAILDIGTGSGCIAVTLKLENPTARVFATDISEQALAVARHNARELSANVSLFKHDILNEDLPVNTFQLILSNPPYIAQTESKTMKANVVDFEPHRALFVADENPLIFYTAIAEKSKRGLQPGGKLLVEIHERMGKAVAKLFSQAGYKQVIIAQDINKKNRMVCATR